MLYAGATDAVAMTVVEISPRAPDLRPLSSCASCVSTGCSAVGMSHPPAFGPVRRRWSVPPRLLCARCGRDRRFPAGSPPDGPDLMTRSEHPGHDDGISAHV